MSIVMVMRFLDAHSESTAAMHQRSARYSTWLRRGTTGTSTVFSGTQVWRDLSVPCTVLCEL